MEELTISKFVFDDWWTSTYVDRCTPLLPQEVEALVDYHWRELQATAIRHSLRETKKDTKEDYISMKENTKEDYISMCDTLGGHEGDPAEGCTCGAIVWQRSGWHRVDCPLYQTPEDCTCGIDNPHNWHFEDCPLYQPA